MSKLRNNLLYCHLSTAAIVTGAIVLDYHEVPYWEVHYSDRCWIAGRRASLVFFALPVLFICLANAFLICLTVHRVRMHKKSMRSVRVTPGGGSSKQKNQMTAETVKKREAMCYVKIGTVFGFTWFIGLISGLFGHHSQESQCMNILYKITTYGKLRHSMIGRPENNLGMIAISSGAVVVDLHCNRAPLEKTRIPSLLPPSQWSRAAQYDVS